MEEKNNIFKFATKELSQDAFICWLINWINFKQDNQQLYSKAQKILNYILKTKGYNENLENYEIEIKKQYKFIDVLILLKEKENKNSKYAIIIEDKTFTTEHDEQIKKYKQNIQAELKDANIITVYYKIYEEPKKINADIIINREYMLNNILNETIKSDIYTDYKNFLNSIEEIYINYKKQKLQDWEKNKKIILPMVAAEYNEKQDNDKLKMRIAQKGGSTFIDWYMIDVKSKQFSKYFDQIYLSLNINNSYELRIRGFIKDSIQYQDNNLKNEELLNKRIEFRKYIEDKCKKNGMIVSNFKNKKAKEGSNVFLTKINLDENMKYEQLMAKIEVLEKIMKEIDNEII